MEKVTLRELCRTTGASRRAVQGYEKAGLVASCGKNGRGHLLYGEAERSRVDRIRLFQRFGFRVKEIARLIDAPADVVCPALEQRIENMKEEKREKDRIMQL